VDYLHVFTYSERANTTAVRMDDSVPMEVRRERTQQLRILSNKLHRAFQERHLGTTRPVLFEAEAHEGRMQGYTDNYVRVSLPFDAALVNTILPVHLERIGGDGHVTGTLEVAELADRHIG
jgi:threonylcarbamoyladenosine tRNA methylthiotransferase MtaB